MSETQRKGLDRNPTQACHNYIKSCADQDGTPDDRLQQFAAAHNKTYVAFTLQLAKRTLDLLAVEGISLEV